MRGINGPNLLPLDPKLLQQLPGAVSELDTGHGRMNAYELAKTENEFETCGTEEDMRRAV